MEGSGTKKARHRAGVARRTKRRFRRLSFAALPKVRRAELQLSDASARLFPETLFGSDFVDKLLGLFAELGIDEEQRLECELSIRAVDDAPPPQPAELTLTGGQAVIGRLSTNQVQLPLKSVSSRHARIHLGGRKCTIEDLDSTNGTVLNGRPLSPGTPEPLRDGDVLRIESYEIQVRVKTTVEGRAPQRLVLRRLGAGSLKAFGDRLAERSLVAELALPPTRYRAYVDIDGELASWIVYRFLGASGPAERPGIPFSELELGIVEYLLLKVIHLVHLAWGPTPRLHLRLRRLAPSEEAALGEGDDLGMVGEWDWRLGERTGYVRLFLPHPVVLEGHLADAVAQQGAGESIERLRRRITTFGGLDIPLWGELGRLELSAGDLASLQPGDVVLIDELGQRLTEGRLEGRLTLRFHHRPDAGGLAARIASDGDTILTVELLEFLRGGPHTMADQAPQSAEPRDDDNLEEAQQLLDEVLMPVKVIVGQAVMTLRDLMRLRPGQILELNKIPGEPVELSVEGRTVARGELVDIEGRLGVRILTLLQ